MLIVAAHAIASQTRGDDLVPDPLDRAVHAAVASAVREAALAGMHAERLAPLG